MGKHLEQALAFCVRPPVPNSHITLHASSWWDRETHCLGELVTGYCVYASSFMASYHASGYARLLVHIKTTPMVLSNPIHFIKNFTKNSILSSILKNRTLK